MIKSKILNLFKFFIGWPLEEFIKKNRYEILLSFFVICYLVYFTTVSFLRHDNFYTGRFDLGNMDQTVWNTLNGQFFQLTDPNGTSIMSRLAFHADFILILLSPFYIIWSNPKMLLLIQTIIVALGAVFIYLLSKHILKDKNLSIVLSFIYLLNPSLQYANLYDFHGVTLASTFLLGTFYFLVKKKYFFFLLFAFLSAITKEQVWVIIALFGLYIPFDILIRHFFIQKQSLGKIIKSAYFIKHFIFGASIFLVSISIFYFLIFYAIPKARGSQHFALSYYSEFGDSPGNIIKNIFFTPQKTISAIFQKDRIEYLSELFLPVGFLPFLYLPTLVFASPDLAINLLSNNKQLHQIYFQYTSTITPFIFISSIYALKLLRKKLPKIPVIALSLYLIAVSSYSAYEAGPLLFAKNPNIDPIIKQQPYKETIDDFLSKIPQKYSIAATNNVGSHISHRSRIYTIPVGVNEADIVIFLLNDPFAQPSLAAQKQMVLNLSKDKNHIQVFKQNDFVVFKKSNL